MTHVIKFLAFFVSWSRVASQVGKRKGGRP